MTRARKRIAVIVSANRLWTWQRQAILRLSRNYDVDKYYTNAAPPYPSSLTAWLHFEQVVFRQSVSVEKICVQSERRWTGLTMYEIILNLSEVPISFPGSMVAELRYDGSPDSIGFMTALLTHQSPHLSVQIRDSEGPVVTSYLNVPDKVVLQRGLQAAFARLVLLVERAIEHIANRTAAKNQLPLIREAIPFSPGMLIRFGARFFVDKLFFSFVRKLQIKEHWSIAIFKCGHKLESDLIDPPVLHASDLILIQDDGTRFFADPFILEDNELAWIFAEELQYATNKGVISCFALSEDGSAKPLGPVLERPYHLSYPFVFRHGDDIFMLPETGASKNVELYRAESFPKRWELYRILLPGIELYDATLFKCYEKWWLFGATSLDGNPPQDELAIYFSDDLEGPWHPHPCNPVKSNCRSARPAGRIIIQNERVFRPSQDCESDYGSGIVWCEITELTTESFQEREVGRWSGQHVGAKGLHNFDQAGKWAVIDIKRTAWKKLKSAAP